MTVASPTFQIEPLVGNKLILGTVFLSLAVFMNVLDTSIANVSIPTISGDLGVSAQQGTWVITSFSVANAISIPLTGWLTKRIGQVRLMIASILLFVLASWLCGMATSLAFLIFARVVQGAVAGPMVPLSQSLLLSSYPPEKANMAMAFWGMTVLVAPIMGPLLGGWISDNFTWPWIFYINIFVGLVAAWGVGFVYKNRETPIETKPVDKVGLVLLITWVACLQVMLDKGKDLGWFDSSTIIVLGTLALIAFLYFVVWELGEDNPIVDLTLFQGLNFTLGTIVLTLGFGLFFGSIVILPLWLQTNMGYTATMAGVVMAQTGPFAVLLTPLVGKLAGKFDVRLIVSVSFGIYALAFFLRANYILETNIQSLIIPNLIQGVAASCFMIPLFSLILSGLSQDRIPAAAGLSNFVRTLGMGISTSLVTTIWEDRGVLHQARLSEHTGTFSPVYNELTHRLAAMGLNEQMAQIITQRLVIVESMTWSMTDIFWGTAILFIAMIGLIWLTKPVKSRVSNESMAAH